MRMLIIIITIIISLLLLACYYNQPYGNPIPTALATISPKPVYNAPESYSAKDEPNAYDAIDSTLFNLPMTLINENDLSVVLKSAKAANSLYIEVLLEVENKTDHLYLLDINQLCINNCMWPVSELDIYNTDFEISQNNTKECRLKIKYDALRSAYGIESITDIGFHYNIFNESILETKYEDSVSISNGLRPENKYLTTEYLIGSDEYLDVYFVDAYRGDNEVEYYEILFYNKSEIDIVARATTFAINGISINPFMSDFIASKSYYLYKGMVNNIDVSFLAKHDKVASIQLELYNLSTEDGSILSNTENKLVINENIKMEKAPIKGQIIYDKKDILLSIEKIYEKENIRWLKIYVENNSNETMLVNITDIMINEKDINQNIYLSALPNTYSAQAIYLNDSILNESYKIVMNCGLSTEFREKLQEETLNFKLKK